MNKKSFWLSILAVIISFIGGFFLANAYNRKEIVSLQSEIGRLKSSSPASQTGGSEQPLTDEEIRQKINEADNNPENVDFQKGLAAALYQYANMKQDAKWLVDVARLFGRVHEKNPKDYNTIISLGNVYFDLAQNSNGSDMTESKEDSQKSLEKSQEFYRKALELKPNDTGARTDLGLTYLFADPPDNNRAIAELQKSLQLNPKDEKTLASLTRAHINSGNINEAADLLEKLKQVNSGNKSVPELETQLAQSKNNKQ